MINTTAVQTRSTPDHSRKSILARGCDPNASFQASNDMPPQIGNPEYVPTIDDEEFISKLRSRVWSVIFFAPGACRYSAASRSIPGSSTQTQGWTLEQYRELVRTYQGDQIRIVETLDERESVKLLEQALQKARETTGHK